MPKNQRPIDPDHLRAVVADIAREVMDRPEWGEATTVVPALKAVDCHQFGMAILTRDGDMVTGGNAETPFSIQSISKVLSLELALARLGDALWERVGREPSGDPYNSVMDLERHKGHPRNPFINAGALVVVDALCNAVEGSETDAVAGFVSDLLGGEPFGIDEEVARSDQEGGHLNRAMASMSKHWDNLHNDIDTVMRAYVRQCAIALSCVQLARVGRFLMLDGPDGASHASGEAARRARRVLSLMLTCGQYDGSGDFAYRVGLPAKSGVGGGILAIAPNTASIAVWAPGLDKNGNSLLGTMALEMLTDRVEWSVFGDLAR